MKSKPWMAVGLAGVLVAVPTGADASEIQIFEETFDTDAADAFFTTDTGNYGDWSECPPPTLTPFSTNEWPVIGNRLRPFTALVPGGGSFPNIAARQIPVPAAVATGRSALRITFDSEVLQGGGGFGAIQGILLHNTLIYFHSSGDTFSARQYTDWFELHGNGYAAGSSAGVVSWDILIEQQGGGTDKFTVLITKDGSTVTNTWTSSDAFQFVNGEFKLGLMGDDGSGSSDVELAYDNLRVWQVPVGEELVFQETFDTAAAADFFTVAPYSADWSEQASPLTAGNSNPDWPVTSGQLRPLTPVVGGGGDFPNTAIRQVTVPGPVADGTLPMRITFDSEVLQQGTFGGIHGVLLHDTLITFNQDGNNFDVRQYSDWFQLHGNGVGLGTGAVSWDILVEQTGGGGDMITATVTTPGGSATESWTSNDAFQYSGNAFTLGFLADDGDGSSAVELAYDNLQVWQVGTVLPTGTVITIR